MADNYNVNETSDPWYQYRNVIGVPSRRRIICGIIWVFLILILVVISFTVLSKKCCSKSEKLEPFFDFQSALNTSASPCDDFYSFTCGKWTQNNPIPPYDARVTTFSVLQDSVDERKKNIFESSCVSQDLPRVVNHAISFYNICTQVNGTNVDSEILLQYFDNIGGWPMLNKNSWNEDLFDWFNASAYLVKFLDIHTVVSVYTIDDKRNGKNVLYLKPPSLEQTLLDGSTAMNMLVSILHCLNNSDLNYRILQNYMDNLQETEKRWLKELSYSHQASRPIFISIEELMQRIPNIDWLSYLQLITNDTLQEVNETVTLNDTIAIENFDYLKKLASVINSDSFSKLELANLFCWYVVKDIWVLIPGVIQKYMAAYVYESTEAKRLACMECYKLIVDSFPCSLDYLYIKNVSDFGIQHSITITNYLKSAFSNILHHSSWLDQPSKEILLHRLSNMQQVIGFQYYLNNKTEFNNIYENFPSLSQNILKYYIQIQQFYVKMRFMYLTIPVRVNNFNWILPRSVTDVSAYYAEFKNTLVFPISLHNPPFYYSRGPGYLNFGAIGSVIGHEMMHGFDNFGNEGSENVIINISNTSRLLFKKHAECFKNQYDIYDPIHKYRNNGSRTLRENIADNEGLHIAYQAFKMYEKDFTNQQRYQILNNYSADQMFFISFGSVWCSHISPNIRKVLKDFHSFPELRVNGAVSNLKSFASAFNCPEGSPMNPSKKCTVW